MTTARWLILFGILAMIACGGDETGSGGGTPGPAPADGPPASAFKPRPLDPGKICMTDWEMYPASRELYPGIEGRVLDPAGNPVPGATATLAFPCISVLITPLRRDSTVTDENGDFRFERVPSNALVIVEKEGFAGEMLPTGQFSDPGADPAPVNLRPGGRIVGTVRLTDGAPAAGVTIVVNCLVPDWFATVVTDAEGRFAVSDVPPVEVGVAPAPGRFRGQLIPVTCVAGEETEVALQVDTTPPLVGKIVDGVTDAPLAGALVRTLGGRGEVGVLTEENGTFALQWAHFPILFISADGYGEQRIQLSPEMLEEPELKLSLVRGAGARGRVVNDRGDPVAGARVLIILDPDGAGVEFRGPVTGADGSFDYTSIPIPRPDMDGIFLAVGEGSLPAPGPRLDLRAGEVHEGVEITLPRGTTVEFRAVDDDGKPVQRGWAHLDGVPPDLPDSVKLSVQSRAAGGGDSEGRFVLSGLSPGPHELVLNLPRRLPVRMHVVVEEGPEQKLPDVVCARGLSISGTVASIGAELPPDLAFFLTDSSDSFRILIEVKPDGSFEIGGLEEKPYTLAASAERHEPATKEVLGGTRDVELRLRALASLTIELAFPEGVRAGGEVDIRRYRDSVGSRRWSKTFTEEEGSVTYQTVLPGQHHIRAITREYVGFAETPVEPGENVKVRIEMKRAASLDGRVYRPGGELAFDVGVELDAGKIWGRNGLRTDDRGIFRFPALPPGEVVVRCHPTGHPPTEATLDLAVGEEAEIELRLAKGATVDLTIVDPDGKPMEGVRAALNTEDGTPGRYWLDGREKANTGTDGKVKLIGIPPGRYLLTLFVGADWRTRMTLDLEEGETWNNEGRPLTIER